MAQKRMFDKAILETDNFLNVSLTAKALYFLLGMEADDEGFVSPKRVIRLYGGEAGDLKNLVDAGLIIPFKSGVVVITDWHTNNWLDSRRTRPTQYQFEKALLTLKKVDIGSGQSGDKKYMLSNSLAGAKPVEKSIVEKSIEDNIKFELFWNLYPKKVEKKKSEEKWNRLKRDVQERIIADLPKRIGGDTWSRGFVLNPTTYLNGERWNDEIKVSATTLIPTTIIN